MRASLPEITSLFTPLILGALALAWYNWARFASPLEFGFRYQITILDLNRLSSVLFQPDYFFLNLYSYTFQPFELLSKFPFIHPVTMADYFKKMNIITPQIYFAGRMTGLLFCVPFLVFSLVHFGSNQKNVPAVSLPIYLLAGSFMLGFLSLMFFFFGQMRYLVDIISQITLLAVLGYWKMISTWQQLDPARSKIFLGLANLLIVGTICVGLLLAVSSDYDRLQTFNPVLFQKISNSLNIRQ